MKSHFADEERVRERRENSGETPSQDKERMRDEYIFGKSHFADEERLREQKDFGKIHSEREERIRESR